MTSTIEQPAKIKHLSWSGIQDYRMCPKRFFFRRIACVPEESRAASLIFGGAIHQATEKLHEARIEGRKTPRTETLLSAFDTAWKEGCSQGAEITFAKGDSAQSLRETAKSMLATYLAHSKADRSKVVAIEHEEIFPLMPDVVPLKARLDLVTIEKNNLIVTDLKTSKSRWSDTKTAEYLPQLVIYAAATAKMVREFGLKRIVPRFVVLTKAKTPVVQVLEPTATQHDVQRLKELVSETADAINKNVFPRREGWQCKGCPFAKRCLGHSEAMKGRHE